MQGCIMRLLHWTRRIWFWSDFLRRIQNISQICLLDRLQDAALIHPLTPVLPWLKVIPKGIDIPTLSVCFHGDCLWREPCQQKQKEGSLIMRWDAFRMMWVCVCIELHPSSGWNHNWTNGLWCRAPEAFATFLNPGGAYMEVHYPIHSSFVHVWSFS
jgi:hypothetical protein